MAYVPSKAQVQAKPNLLIIQTDEHNFRTLGCYRENDTWMAKENHSGGLNVNLDLETLTKN